MMPLGIGQTGSNGSKVRNGRNERNGPNGSNGPIASAPQTSVGGILPVTIESRTEPLFWEQMKAVIPEGGDIQGYFSNTRIRTKIDERLKGIAKIPDEGERERQVVGFVNEVCFYYILGCPHIFNREVSAGNLNSEWDMMLGGQIPVEVKKTTRLPGDLYPQQQKTVWETISEQHEKQVRLHPGKRVPVIISVPEGNVVTWKDSIEAKGQVVKVIATVEGVKELRATLYKDYKNNIDATYIIADDLVLETTKGILEYRMGRNCSLIAGVFLVDEQLYGSNQFLRELKGYIVDKTGDQDIFLQEMIEPLMGELECKEATGLAMNLTHWVRWFDDYKKVLPQQLVTSFDAFVSVSGWKGTRSQEVTTKAGEGEGGYPPVAALPEKVVEAAIQRQVEAATKPQEMVRGRAARQAIKRQEIEQRISVCKGPLEIHKILDNFINLLGSVGGQQRYESTAAQLTKKLTSVNKSLNQASLTMDDNKLKTFRTLVRMFEGIQQRVPDVAYLTDLRNAVDQCIAILRASITAPPAASVFLPPARSAAAAAAPPAGPPAAAGVFSPPARSAAAETAAETTEAEKAEVETILTTKLDALRLSCEKDRVSAEVMGKQIQEMLKEIEKTYCRNKLEDLAKWLDPVFQAVAASRLKTCITKGGFKYRSEMLSKQLKTCRDLRENNNVDILMKRVGIEAVTSELRESLKQEDCIKLSDLSIDANLGAALENKNIMQAVDSAKIKEAIEKVKRLREIRQAEASAKRKEAIEKVKRLRDELEGVDGDDGFITVLNGMVNKLDSPASSEAIQGQMEEVRTAGELVIQSLKKLNTAIKTLQNHVADDDTTLTEAKVVQENAGKALEDADTQLFEKSKAIINMLKSQRENLKQMRAEEKQQDQIGSCNVTTLLPAEGKDVTLEEGIKKFHALGGQHPLLVSEKNGNMHLIYPTKTGYEISPFAITLEEGVKKFNDLDRKQTVIARDMATNPEDLAINPNGVMKFIYPADTETGYNTTLCCY